MRVWVMRHQPEARWVCGGVAMKRAMAFAVQQRPRGKALENTVFAPIPLHSVTR